MQLQDPVSTLMSTTLYTVAPHDELNVVVELFQQHGIHHVPVVEDEALVGLVTYSDIRFFQNRLSTDADRFREAARMRAFKAQDIMTPAGELVTLKPDSTVREAIDLLLGNRFHAIPVLRGTELVGIFTTHDVLRAVVK